MKHLSRNGICSCVLFILLNNNIFPTDLCGPTSGTLTLAGSPYIVTCNVLVPDGQTLTIEPGVVIKFDLGYTLEVAGTLIAEGSEGSNVITFTSNVPVPGTGDWGKIYFMESENSSLAYCTIEYAGAPADPSAVSLWMSDVSIQNTIIRKSSGSGVTISSSAPIINNSLITEVTGIGIESDAFSNPVISNCTFSNNSDFAISIHAQSVSNIDNVDINQLLHKGIRVLEGHVNTGTWKNHDAPYIIDGDITVDDEQTLTIDPGTYLLFDGIYIFQVDGSLVANGEPGNNILFSTHILYPYIGYWDQLYFNNSESSSLKYCTIEYGGSSYGAINMLNSNPYLEEVLVCGSGTNGINLTNSSPEIVNCEICNNAGTGIIASFDSKPIVNSCEIDSNGVYAISMYADNIKFITGAMDIHDNYWNSISVEGGIVSSGTWLNHSGIQKVPYVINGNITVADGEVLTIDPGSELRFSNGYIFEVNGALIADGTENFPIIFTSNEVIPSAGDWKYLSFSSSDPLTKLNYCQILYGGSNTAALNLTLSSFSITNTVIKYSNQAGIYLTNSSPTLRECTVQQNIGTGVHIVSGRPDLGTIIDLGYNSFGFNGNWEVYNNTADTIFAQGNFWGVTNPADVDFDIYDDDENASKGIVVFLPFLVTPPTDVEEDNDLEIPIDFIIEQNYPNPFNPGTNIQFSLPQTSFVILGVFNAIGERVDLLVSEELNAGTYKYVWDASNFTSGIYYYTLIADDFRQTKKMVLLK